jgi:predicted phosphodiesterase
VSGIVRRRVRRGIYVATVTVAFASACLTPTPFGGDPEEVDLNAKNLERLKNASVALGESFRFVALGDTHAEYDELERSVRAINAQGDVDLVVHMGDQTNQGLLREFEWEHEVMGELEPPVLFTLGNHDALSDGEAIYRRMYGPLDYAFDHHGYRFVSFNSNNLEFPDTVPNRAWLEREVYETSPRFGVIVFTHHSPETSDASPETIAFYRSLLRSGRVALWIHGHTGRYKLKQTEGVPVIQTGNYHETLAHVRVTTHGRRFEVDFCHLEVCKRLSPEEDPAVVGGAP